MTEAIFEGMMEKSWYDGDLKSILRSVIEPQFLHYPAPMMKKGGLDPINQQNGQLMGSTLSFPILCIINLVAYWAALEEYTQRAFDPRDCHV
jgi:hypothetical protein